jgi:hypothetical protein
LRLHRPGICRTAIDRERDAALFLDGEHGLCLDGGLIRHVEAALQCEFLDDPTAGVVAVTESGPDELQHAGGRHDRLSGNAVLSDEGDLLRVERCRHHAFDKSG